LRLNKRRYTITQRCKKEAQDVGGFQTEDELSCEEAVGRKEESKVKKQIQVGSTALVRLYDGREVEAKVTAIVNGPAGQRFISHLERFALKVDPTQILRNVKDDSDRT
jgi:hypothetical protein